jgi:hypothetical protein
MLVIYGKELVDLCLGSINFGTNMVIFINFIKQIKLCDKIKTLIKNIIFLSLYGRNAWRLQKSERDF